MSFWDRHRIRKIKHVKTWGSWHKQSKFLSAPPLARSTFHYQQAALQIVDKYAATRDQVKAIYDLHKGRYGYRRITATLRRQGNVINYKTVQRLMEELQLKSPGVFTARSSAAPDLSVRHEMQDARCRSARALAAQPTCHAAGQHRTRSQRS